jgi:hypothetical protein
MVSTKIILAALATIATVAALGTRCTCRNDKYSRTFPGIQHVCDDMDDWHSSKCNVFGVNCDYCTYSGTKGDPRFYTR